MVVQVGFCSVAPEPPHPPGVDGLGPIGPADQLRAHQHGAVQLAGRRGGAGQLELRPHTPAAMHAPGGRRSAARRQRLCMRLVDFPPGRSGRTDRPVPAACIRSVHCPACMPRALQLGVAALAGCR